MGNDPIRILRCFICKPPRKLLRETKENIVRPVSRFIICQVIDDGSSLYSQGGVVKSGQMLRGPSESILISHFPQREMLWPH